MICIHPQNRQYTFAIFQHSVTLIQRFLHIITFLKHPFHYWKRYFCFLLRITYNPILIVHIHPYSHHFFHQPNYWLNQSTKAIPIHNT